MEKVMCEICKKEPATIILQSKDVCSDCWKELWKIVDNNKEKISWTESINRAFKKLKQRNKND